MSDPGDAHLDPGNDHPGLLPLTGCRVVSLAEQFPGPFATMLLSDLGADVVQVERPAGGDPARAFPGLYAALNRGKRSVALDLKHPDGVEACRRLVDRADVLLEGYRPGVMDRLGLGYGELSARNPNLVYVSISGFGQDGPYRDRPAHDLSFQALAGLMSAPGAQGAPVPPPVPMLSLADLVAGVFGALAALTGVAARSAGGLGRAERAGGGHYDVSMFDVLTSFMIQALVPAANGTGMGTLGHDPAYGVYATADARWLTLSIAFEDHFWRRLCDVLDLPDVAGLDAGGRAARREDLSAVLAGRLLTGTAADWEAALTAAGVPCGIVNDVPGVLRDRHVQARGLLQPLVDAPAGPRYLRQPLIVDGRRPGPRGAPAGLGEHTVEVLSELGYSPEAIKGLLAQDAATSLPVGVIMN